MTLDSLVLNRMSKATTNQIMETIHRVWLVKITGTWDFGMSINDQVRKERLNGKGIGRFKKVHEPEPFQLETYF